MELKVVFEPAVASVVMFPVPPAPPPPTVIA
jgi:hypothetical protein